MTEAKKTDTGTTEDNTVSVDLAVVEGAAEKLQESIDTVLAEQARKKKPARMTQAQMKQFDVLCMVCGTPLTDRRAKARKETCDNPDCGKRLKAFRRAVVESRKCPACYHPSTPQEREDYKQWRKDRGQMQRRRGNPHGRKPKTPTELLEATLPHLEALKLAVERQQIFEMTKEGKKELTTLVTSLQKLFAQSAPE